MKKLLTLTITLTATLALIAVAVVSAFLGGMALDDTLATRILGIGVDVPGTFFLDSGDALARMMLCHEPGVISRICPLPGDILPDASLVMERFGKLT